MLENQRILIVGVTGKVGPMLAEKLCYQNRVIGVSRFSDSESRKQIAGLPVHPICFDVTRDSLYELPREVDYVFFEFAYMHGAEENPDYAWQVNVLGPARLAEYYKDAKGIIVASTGSVYPITADGADENRLPEPEGVYSLNRYAQEEVLRMISCKHNLPMVFLRYFHAYTEEWGFIPRLTRKIENEELVEFEEKHRNVIWQEDLVRCTIEAAHHCRVSPDIINICGPEKVELRKLAMTIGTQLGKRVRFGRTPHYEKSLLGKSNKMMGLFGPPKVGLDEGVRRVTEHFKEF